VGRWAARTWFLTGTPAPNDPIDIWSMLRFTGATPLPLATFTNRYLNVRPTAYSPITRPKPLMVAELRNCINSMSLRRTKADVAAKWVYQKIICRTYRVVVRSCDKAKAVV
jgi:hypothetical protein